MEKTDFHRPFPRSPSGKPGPSFERSGEPAGDEVITEDGIRLIVEKLDKNRIEKVHVYLPEKDPKTLDNTES